jgi:RNA polymerase sigma-70 factor (ECF subfamily)
LTGAADAEASNDGRAGADRVRAIVLAHFDAVARLLRSLGVKEADVEDAAQQVFMVVARRADDLAPEAERAFLFRTAVHVAAHARRTLARRREQVDEAPQPVGTPPAPDELLDQRRARERLDRILDAMPVDLRTVFVLFEIDEMPMPQIAELLQLPIGTVASRLRRARADFEQRVKREGGQR